MKKELGILILIFTVAIGFSGAVAAVNGDAYNQGAMWKNNKNNKWGQGWTVIWRGSWNKWRHSWWWRHGFKGNNFWFKGKHHRKIINRNKFGQRTVIIIRR